VFTSIAMPVLVDLGVETVGTVLVSDGPESPHGLVVVHGRYVVLFHEHHVSRVVGQELVPYKIQVPPVVVLERCVRKGARVVILVPYIWDSLVGTRESVSKDAQSRGV